MDRRIAGCVVLYNPPIEVVNNIETYRPKLDRLVVLDNSTDYKNGIISSIIKHKNVIYIKLRGNRGIASALNTGCEELIKQGYKIVLTMDQDSEFPSQCWDHIEQVVQDQIEQYGVLGLNYNHSSESPTDTITEVSCWMTSGNFVNLAAFRKVGGFREDLFIDYVDIDFNHRLIKKGYKVGYLADYSISHRIGNPIPINFFGRTFYAMNHAPFRYYYRYRNCIALLRDDPSFYFPKLLFEMSVNLIKTLVFEKDRKKKVGMIFRGIIDGITQNMGKLDSND